MALEPDVAACPASSYSPSNRLRYSGSESFLSGRLVKTIGLTLGSIGTATASTSPLTLVWNWIFQLRSASAGSLSALGALKTS